MICRLLVVLLLTSPLTVLAQDNTKVRESQLFNFGWKFQMGDTKDAASPDFNDAGWRTLDLPHDFQIEQPWDKAGGAGRGYKAMGAGWYRKTFKAHPAWKNKKVILDFEGAMLNGEVWFNGKKVVSIDYGYLGYEADISRLINFEGDNVVAVYTTTKGNSRWYTGGGLFRDVHLVVKDPISVARNGVFVTTPLVNSQKAEIAVQVEMEGISNTSMDIEIKAVILSRDGRQVGETKIWAPKKNKLKTVEVSMPLIAISRPQLWSCETPNLYTVEVSISNNGKVIDRVTESFGIRTLEFSPQSGFKLNGKKVFLKGMANHHDLGAVGAAVYDWSIERLFKQLKAFGYNHIRTSHNPYSKSFLNLADKYGILIVDELSDKWSENDYWPGSKPFSQLWYKMIPEWIKRDRNHPSVILWSLGNELQMREDLAGFATGDWGVTTYKIMDVLVKRYDTTRKTTVAMYPARANAVTGKDADFNKKLIPPELSLVTEVASYNYQYTAYAGYLKHAPDLIVYQSEATSSELAAPYFGMDYNKMVGLAYWGAVEYWGESNGWPKKGWNYSFFSHTLEPYPQAYLIKSAFGNEPLVHIGVVDKEMEKLEWNDVIVGKMPLSSHWNRTPGTKVNLFTYTNADEVELMVNGKSVGVQKNNRDSITRRNMIYWKSVPYGNGGNVIAIARSGGREVARHKMETAGKAVALKIEAENPDWKANGLDAQYVKVYAVDNKGRVVSDASGEVKFDVSGGASLVAVDNGDHYTNETFAGNTRSLHNGFVMAVLRSGKTAGEVVIRASSASLKSAEIKTRVK